MIAALLATNLAFGAEGPQLSMAGAPQPLIPLATTWNMMGNGGPQTLPGRCDVGIDSQKSADGSPLYSIRCTSAVLPSFGGARMNFDVKSYRGKRVRVSASLMAADIASVANAQYPNVVGEAGLWIGIGTPRDGMRQDRMQNRSIKGSTGWEVRDFVVDIPADADRLQAGYWMQGKGQFWMRDLKVEEVPSTVAVNWNRDALNPEAAPALSLAPIAAARPTDRFLPPPEKWLAMGEQNFELCDAGIDAKVLAAGQRNLSIACTVPVRAYLRHVFEAAPWWGKRVRLSAWLKTENVEPKTGGDEQPGAAMFLSTSGYRGTLYNAAVTGTTDWKYYEIVIDIPAGSPSPYIPMGLSLIGKGQLWARDFRFEEVSHDTPVTPMAAPNRRDASGSL
jgi:hypothetical protein